MRFQDSYIPGGLAWSSPFVRWQGSLAEVSALDLAVDVTRLALERAEFDANRATDLTLGITIPQPGIFYGAPTVAARLGAERITGPMIAQACATSVASLAAAAGNVELTPEVHGDDATINLVVAADRLSNGPHLVFPKPSNMGGYPVTEDWVLDNFKCDPWAGAPMIETAEAVAREGGFSRQQIDEVCLQRYEQYTNYRAGLGGAPGFLVPYEKGTGRRRIQVLDDEGIHATTADGLAALSPVEADGVITYGTQTHPADGAAGAVVTRGASARTLSRDGTVAQLLASGVARAEAARMPKAPVPAARNALRHAGLSIEDVDLVVTHNPFAVNDLWFARETGFDLDRMNLLGCSLVYGHPQAATGLRGVVELIEALRERGGGVGMFTGCAAGDSAAALIVRVTD